MRTNIHFGISEPNAPDINTLIKFARTAEKCGFNSIHVGDHVFKPFESLTALTAIAMKTTKLKIATHVLDMNRRNPATTAHVTATLDHVSGGRLILGVGCGIWNWPTYTVSNIGDTGRLMASRKVRRAKEAIEVLKKFWTEPRVDYKGNFYHFTNASIKTNLSQHPHPPVWVAAYGIRMKQIAAQFGDGFITQTMPSFMCGEEIEQVKGFAKEAGRNPMKIKTIFASLTGIGRNRDAAVRTIQERARSLLFYSVRDHADHHNKLAERLGYDRSLPWEKPEDVSSADICRVYLIGTPEDIITRIEEYMKEGISYIIVMGLRTIESLNLFSEKVISSFNG
ncbi:MAG: LLM class flavin-dependent oxidoreductase [Candidatus Bathyarchaeota archaeon]|nr:MAG: LLM class flavin-dependent oxidoreductase [Candidatus Bathyarchaeota archaeon]